MRFLSYYENEMKTTEAVKEAIKTAYIYHMGLFHIALQFETTGVERALEVYEWELRHILNSGHHTGVKVVMGQKGELDTFTYHGQDYKVKLEFKEGAKILLDVTLNGEEVKKFNWRLGFAIYKVALGTIADFVNYGEKLDM